MARDKKSFVLYCDLIHTVEKLSDDDAGKLLKHILNYVNDNEPSTDNLLVEVAFEPIKQSLKRDLAKYESRAERARKNGKKGGRPKTQTNPEKPSGLYKNTNEPRKPDSVSDSVSVSVKEREEKFAEQVRSLPTDLPKDEIDQFIIHWTEMNPNGRKMKFEKEKTFDPKKRLAKWTANYHKWKKEKSFAKKEKEPNQISDYDQKEQNLLAQLKKSLIQVYGDFQNQSEQKRIVNEIRMELLKIEPNTVKDHYKKIVKYCEQKRGTEKQYLKNLKSLIHGS